MDPDGPLPMSTPDEDLAAEIDASEYADQKVAALRAHRTQIEVDGPFFALSNHIGNQVWGIESYRIAKGRRGDLGPNGLETDLFAGL
jgi:N-acetyl-1-D-myo-inositol-2-amino-2-deoxy-alpha-D-glucopyranoside deacetylase